MRAIPLRTQLGFVAAGYALALAAATAMLIERYLLYVNHPQDVAAAGGMYAFGDVMLEIFIACMLLVPTITLALVIRKTENLYTLYSQAMFGLSLTLPICLGLLFIPAINQGMTVIGEICTARMFASPVMVVGFVLSRLLSRFDRAKRWTLYALLVEVLTLVVMGAMMMISVAGHDG